MHFLHGFLCWLVAHCWSCRVGASWRFRRDPGTAGRVFLTRSFLRFSLVAMLLEITPAVLTYLNLGPGRAAIIAVMAILAGVATGLAHGSAAYN